MEGRRSDTWEFVTVKFSHCDRDNFQESSRWLHNFQHFATLPGRRKDRAVAYCSHQNWIFCLVTTPNIFDDYDLQSYYNSRPTLYWCNTTDREWKCWMVSELLTVSFPSLTYHQGRLYISGGFCNHDLDTEDKDILKTKDIRGDGQQRVAVVKFQVRSTGGVIDELTKPRLHFIANMKHARGGHVTCIYKNRLFVFGGAHRSESVKTVEFFQINISLKNQWETVPNTSVYSLMGGCTIYNNFALISTTGYTVTFLRIIVFDMERLVVRKDLKLDIPNSPWR